MVTRLKALALAVGSPLVAGAAVQVEVIDQIKGEKVIHYVKRRRKHSSQRTKGHRQQLTLVRVTDILATVPPELAARARGQLDKVGQARLALIVDGLSAGQRRVVEAVMRRLDGPPDVG